MAILIQKSNSLLRRSVILIRGAVNRTGKRVSVERRGQERKQNRTVYDLLCKGDKTNDTGA